MTTINMPTSGIISTNKRMPIISALCKEKEILFNLPELLRRIDRKLRELWDELERVKFQDPNRAGRFVSPNPDCETCNGKGILPSGRTCMCEHPNVNQYNELKTFRQQMFDMKLNLTEEYYPSSFMTLEKVLQKTGNEFIYQLAQDYVRNEVKKGTWLVLNGPAGVGKSQTAAAICVYGFMNYSFDISLWPIRRLLRRCRHYINPDDNADSYEEEENDNTPYFSESEFIDSLIEIDLLVLDDLGKELFNPEKLWAQNRISEIIEERHLTKKPTIITTNFTAKEIEVRYQYHIMRRILERTQQQRFFLTLKKNN